MKNILYKSLIEYHNKTYPFHMPGHKLGRKFDLKKMPKIDVTEVKGTDNLHNPKGIVKEAQLRASITFGSDRTYFLVNGSTSGILAAITSICKDGDTILMARNCHKSVYNSVLINNLKPIYLYPEIIDNLNIAGGINPKDVEVELVRNKEIKVVVITSPTYEGFVSNIKEIAKLVHKYNRILIVDEAHGAHFAFNSIFPKTALEMGADIVIQSTHKTLPSLTQSAMLHVNGNRVDHNKLQDKLGLFQTSSPSYILMSSLDYCRALIDKNGEKLFNLYSKKLLAVRKKLSNLDNLKLIDERVKGNSFIYDMDYSKIIITSNNTNIKGTELDEILRNKYNLQIELSSLHHIIAMTSIGDSHNGFRKLTNSLRKIDKFIRANDKMFEKYDIIKAVQFDLPKNAMQKPKRDIFLEKANGKIAGEYIIPYPPGIPIIVPGEIISQSVINHIIACRKNGIEILGMKDKKNEMIQIID